MTVRLTTAAGRLCAQPSRRIWSRVQLALEAKMKCGLGQCGRCNIGPAYVCKHDPVFRYDEPQELLGEY
jgi:hypothetical protein